MTDLEFTTPKMGTPERKGGKPRENADDAFATMMSMSDEVWTAFASSPGVPHGLTMPEQIGFHNAAKLRCELVPASTEPATTEPEPARIYAHTADGWIVDAETGEIVGRRDVVEQFRVTDLASAEWVLARMQETDAQILAETAILQARVEAQQKRIDVQKRRRAWLDTRFAQELEVFAAQELDGKKTRTLETGFGKLSFRKGVQKITVREGCMETAIAVCLNLFPDAVKVTESLLVSELKGHEAELPGDLFEIVPATDKFSISTGVAK